MSFIYMLVFSLSFALHKRGIDWWNQGSSYGALFNAGRGNVSWYYNWKQLPSNDLSGSSLEFVPMVQTNADLAYFQNNKIVAGNIDTLLGFNEPDDPGQANMTPEDAAEKYKTIFKPLKDQGKIRRLSSPAVTNNGLGPDGWLDKFLRLCCDCGIDFIAYHWYANSFNYWKECYTNASSFGYPIWVTEWAVTQWNANNPVDLATVTSQSHSIVEHLEAQTNIERYAYFPIGPLTGEGDASLGYNTALVSTSGQLTELGTWYIAATANEATEGTASYTGSCPSGPTGGTSPIAPHTLFLLLVFVCFVLTRAQ